jgi:hypothetical protein
MFLPNLFLFIFVHLNHNLKLAEMFRLDAAVSKHDLSVGVRSHTSEVRALFPCVLVLNPQAL